MRLEVATAREMKFMSNVVKVMIQQATDRQSVVFDGDDAREMSSIT